MNKQELINQLEIKVKQWKAYPSDFHRGMTHAYKGALSSAEQLDEPQKPKTEVFNHDEKFVVEWLDHTTGYHYSLYNAINDAGSEVRSWMKIGFNSNRFARAFMSMDYEVEKEPLYYVRLPYEVWDEEAAELKTEYLYLHYEITSDETRIFPTKEPRKGFVAKLDELTIKSADSDYITSFNQSLLNVNIDVTSSLDCASYYKFTDLKKAEAVATLVDGSVEEG